MPSKCPPGPHLNSSYGLHTHSGLRQISITCSFPSLPDRILQVLRLLSQLLQLVHLVNIGDLRLVEDDDRDGDGGLRSGVDTVGVSSVQATLLALILL